MALLKTIKNSFVNGWNKNKNKVSNETTDTIDVSTPSLYIYSHTNIPRNFPFHQVFNEVPQNIGIASRESKKYLFSPYYLDNTTPNNSIRQQSFTNISTSFGDENTKDRYENPFKLPPEVLASTNNYKFIYENALNINLQDGLVDADTGQKVPDGTPVKAAMLEIGAVPSLFNPLYGIHICGVSENNPLLDNADSIEQGTVDSTLDAGDKVVFNTATNYQDLTDCSIKKLVELSTADNGESFPPLGRCTYKYTDFMYCKDLGKVANNHLITLRRFAYPIGDDIWTNVNKFNGLKDDDGNPLTVKIPVDVGRLVCYLGEENKLEDILKYKYSDSWRPLNSEIEQKDSTSESDDRGILGSIVNLGNSAYRQFQGAGRGEGNNKILNWVAGNVKLPIVGEVFQSKGQYSSGEGRTLLTNYDKHKVYEKKGTVQDTHIYEGKLQFAQEFTLIFDYELRACENINPKAAFLDLLSNILAVTYKKGDFWRGEQKLIGTPENIKGWPIADGIVNNTLDKVGGFMDSFLRGDISSDDILGTLSNMWSSTKGFFGDAVAGITSVFTGNANEWAKELGITIADKSKEFEVGKVLKGMLKNRLGRPSVYAFNSLLSGSPVGLWHVTIGNPRNPIMAMGNLIITESTIQHYGPLGIDDFPTGIKVAVTLKHAKSRDAVEISKMYTRGSNSIYLNFVNSNNFKDYFNIINTNKNIFGTKEADNLIRALATTKGG